MCLGSLNSAFDIVDYKAAAYGNFWEHMPFVGQAFNNVAAYEDRTTELADVIGNHSADDVAAVLLLHFHHRMEPGEILLEKIDEKEAITSPVYTASLSGDDRVVPHSFALQQRGDKYAWVATEFVLDDAEGTQQALTDSMLGSPGFMDAMAVKLLETGLWTVFGVQTLHREQVFLQEDEALIEESTKPWEEEGRISRFWPHPQSDIDYTNNPTLLKTTWAFQKAQDTKVWVCAGNCSGCSHCTSNTAQVNADGERIDSSPTELKAKKIWVCAGNCSSCSHCTSNTPQVNADGERIDSNPTELKAKKIWVCAGNCSGCTHCTSNTPQVNADGERIDSNPTELKAKKIWVCAGNCSSCSHCTSNTPQVNADGEQLDSEPTPLVQVSQ